MALTDTALLLLLLLTLQCSTVRIRTAHVHGKRHPEHAPGSQTNSDQSNVAPHPSIYIPSHFIQYPHPRFTPILEILKQRQQVQMPGTLQSGTAPTPEQENNGTGTSEHGSPVKRQLQDNTRRLLSLRRSESVSPVQISNDLPSEHRSSLSIVRKPDLDSSEREVSPAERDIPATIHDRINTRESDTLSSHARSMDLSEEGMHLNSLDRTSVDDHSSATLDRTSPSADHQSPSPKNLSLSSSNALTSNHSALPSDRPSTFADYKLSSITQNRSAYNVSVLKDRLSPSEDHQPEPPNSTPPSADFPSVASERPSPSLDDSSPSADLALSNHPVSFVVHSLPTPSFPNHIPSPVKNPPLVSEQPSVSAKYFGTPKNTFPVQKRLDLDEIASSILSLGQDIRPLFLRYGPTYANELFSNVPSDPHEFRYATAAENTPYGPFRYNDLLDRMAKTSSLTGYSPGFGFLFEGNEEGKKIQSIPPASVLDKILGNIWGFAM